MKNLQKAGHFLSTMKKVRLESVCFFARLFLFFLCYCLAIRIGGWDRSHSVRSDKLEVRPDFNLIFTHERSIKQSQGQKDFRDGLVQWKWTTGVMFQVASNSVLDKISAKSHFDKAISIILKLQQMLLCSSRETISLKFQQQNLAGLQFIIPRAIK